MLQKYTLEICFLEPNYIQLNTHMHVSLSCLSDLFLFDESTNYKTVWIIHSHAVQMDSTPILHRKPRLIQNEMQSNNLLILCQLLLTASRFSTQNYHRLDKRKLRNLITD